MEDCPTRPLAGKARWGLSYLNIPRKRKEHTPSLTGVSGYRSQAATKRLSVSLMGPDLLRRLLCLLLLWENKNKAFALGLPGSFGGLGLGQTGSLGAGPAVGGGRRQRRGAGGEGGLESSRQGEPWVSPGEGVGR